jgi:hypothetical protein
VDVLAELTVNHWNGSVEPQLRVLETFAYPDRAEEPIMACDDEEWWLRFEAAYEAPASGSFRVGAAAEAGTEGAGPEGAGPEGAEERVRMDCPAEVALGEILSSGEALTVVTADARRRWASLGGAAGLARFGGEGQGEAAVFWAGSPAAWVRSLENTIRPRITVCDYSALETFPLRGPGTVLLYDPPASPVQLAAGSEAGGMIVSVGDPAARIFAERASAERHELTAHLRAAYRALRDLGGQAGGLRTAIAGEVGMPHAPETSATLLRILVESGAVDTDGKGAARRAGVVSSVKIELEDSPEFRRQTAIHKEQIAFLRQSKSH